MQKNSIDLVFALEEDNQINEALKVLESTLLPKLTVLEKDDKQDMLIMGDRSLGFVEKSLEIARQDTELLRSFVDVTLFENDVKAINRLRALSFKLSQLVSAVDDSFAVAGNEAYKTSLMVYSLMKNAAQMGHPGAKEKVADLKERFPNKPKKKAVE